MGQALSIREKALTINSDASIYGSLAEIGAGQETARWFFRTRGASSTVAKAISAYDMSFSDAIYGREDSGRYVCESRVQRMLDHEYGLLKERLSGQRGNKTRFFAFANTVAARSQKTGETGRGWLGLRWQTKTGGAVNEVRLYIRLLDKRNTLQQEALGNVGVNLIYGAYFLNNRLEEWVESLKQDVEEHRFEIDFITIEGDDFKNVDCRLLNFYLVRHRLTKAIAINAAGRACEPAELLFKKNVLLFRAHYRPISHYHLDLFECAETKFAKDLSASPPEISRVAEIPLSFLQTDRPDEKEFLERSQLLAALKIPLVVTQFSAYYQFHKFVEQIHSANFRFLIKADELTNLLDEETYKELKGGMLEGLGLLIQDKVRFLVSPSLKRQTVLDSENFVPPTAFAHFYQHLMENQWIQGTSCLDQEHLKIRGDEILSEIQKGSSDWKEKLPEEVSRLILEHGFFKAL